IDARLAPHAEAAEYALASTDGAALAWLYRHGQVIARDDAADAVHVRVRLTPAERARFEEGDVSG
ncbi:MAG: GTPase HflX, partial [Acetobacteraceae bacterium]